MTASQISVSVRTAVSRLATEAVGQVDLVHQVQRAGRLGEVRALHARDVAQRVFGELAEAVSHRRVLGGELLVAGRRLADAAQQRPVAQVHLDRRLERPAHRLGRVAGPGFDEAALRVEQLEHRLPADPHQEVGEVVEVPIEDRPADARLAHHGVDAEVRIGALADQLGGGLDDPPAALLPAHPSLRAAVRWSRD